MLLATHSVSHLSVGEKKISAVCHGLLPDTYEMKLRDVFDNMQCDIEASPYGSNREAGFIGEFGTVGDDAISSHNIKLHVHNQGYSSLDGPYLNKQVIL